MNVILSEGSGNLDVKVPNINPDSRSSLIGPVGLALFFGLRKVCHSFHTPLHLSLRSPEQAAASRKGPCPSWARLSGSQHKADGFLVTSDSYPFSPCICELILTFEQESPGTWRTGSSDCCPRDCCGASELKGEQSMSLKHRTGSGSK